jgi:hypothetical protein
MQRAKDGMRSTNDYSITLVSHWKWFDEDYSACLDAGVGYRIWSMADKELDFNLKDDVAIKNLFNYTQKSNPLKEYKFLETPLENNQPSEGWNIIGGMNTTSFDLSNKISTNVPDNGDFSGVLYYYNVDVSDSNWTQHNLAYEGGVFLSPYVTFFVQTTSNSNFEFAKSGLSLDKVDPAKGFRAAEENEVTKDVLRLVLNQGSIVRSFDDSSTLSDRTYLEFGENFKEEFQAGEDAFAMLSNEPRNPQLWSWYASPMLTKSGEVAKDENGQEMIRNYSLFVNRRPAPEGTREIQLGLTIPQDGEYVFSLDQIQKKAVSAAFLIDKDRDEKIDLLSGGTYTVSLGKGTSTSRFKLAVKIGGGTPIEEITAGKDIFAYANNHILMVKNLNEGDQVRILDLSGRTVASGVASGNEYSVALSQKGVYLVDVKGEKTVVLKVVNK